jgi:hypothetical protein
MFSNTTMASSTTSPIASTRPSSVSDRDGHHHRGDQRRAEAAQKQLQNHEHEEQRETERPDDPPHRGLDEFGPVVVDLQRHALGQIGAHPRRLGAHTARDLDGIRIGALFDR